MAISGGSKAGIILGAILPLCTYIYTEQQKHLEHQRQKHEQRLRDEQLAAEKDRDMALRLLNDLRTQGMDGANACERYATEIAMVGAGLYGPATQGVLVALLTRPGRAADGRTKPRICGCSESIGDLEGPRDESERPSASELKVVQRLSTALAQCRGDEPVAVAAAQKPPTPESSAPLPAPVPAQPQPTPAPVEPAAPVIEPAPSPEPAPALPAPTASFAQIQQTHSISRVFLHIADATQRPFAECLREGLSREGYSVPGIETVGARAPRANELRFAYDEDQTEAERIAKTLGALKCGGAGAAAFSLKPIPAYRDRVTRYRFEVWIARPPSLKKH